MINSPTNAPCWVVVYRHSDSDRNSAQVFLRRPSMVGGAERARSGILPFEGHDPPYCTLLRFVEPFIDEADAIAAAIRLDGVVAKYNPSGDCDPIPEDPWLA